MTAARPALSSSSDSAPAAMFYGAPRTPAGPATPPPPPTPSSSIPSSSSRPNTRSPAPNPRPPDAAKPNSSPVTRATLRSSVTTPALEPLVAVVPVDGIALEVGRSVATRRQHATATLELLDPATSASLGRVELTDVVVGVLREDAEAGRPLLQRIELTAATTQVQPPAASPPASTVATIGTAKLTLPMPDLPLLAAGFAAAAAGAGQVTMEPFELAAPATVDVGVVFTAFTASQLIEVATVDLVGSAGATERWELETARVQTFSCARPAPPASTPHWRWACAPTGSADRLRVSRSAATSRSPARAERRRQGRGLGRRRRPRVRRAQR